MRNSYDELHPDSKHLKMVPPPIRCFSNLVTQEIDAQNPFESKELH